MLSFLGGIAHYLSHLIREGARDQVHEEKYRPYVGAVYMGTCFRV